MMQQLLVDQGVFSI